MFIISHGKFTRSDGYVLEIEVWKELTGKLRKISFVQSLWILDIHQHGRFYGKLLDGKSSTGNNIIGSKEFGTKHSSSGVTATSELSTIELEDGQVLNVINTSGMFDSSLDLETIGEQIVRCIIMAKDGLHAVLVVFSIRSQFSEEENVVVISLVALFKTKIYDFIIMVFTGGDELEDDGKSLEDFLHDSPEALKVELCYILETGGWDSLDPKTGQALITLPHYHHDNRKGHSF
nr:immune-associated nucleotide-binding protein 9-like [Tanacetum cinerariifolium]